MKYVKSILIYGLIAFCSTANSYGQCDPILQTDSAELIFDGAVNKFVVQDNYMYAGGNFRAVGKFSGSFIEIDKNTGRAVNRRMWPKVNGPSNVIADGSGNYIVYGSFDTIGGVPRQSLAIINASGVLTSFAITTDGTINAALVYNNVLYMGGDFTNINGIPRNRLGAINLNTGLVTVWNPDASNSGPLPCRVECMLQSGSNIYVGGAFSNIGGAARKNIAVVDPNNGTAGTWAPQAYFATNPNYGSVLKMLKVNNRLYICGSFDFVGGSIHSDVAAIDLTTGVSTSWSPNPNSVVLSLANKGDTLYLGGAFFQISGLSRQGFAAYSIASGSLLPIAINTKKLVAERIYSILPVGNTIYLGGTFDTMNGQVRKNLGAFDRLTGAALPWTSHTNGDVTSIIEDNGKLLVAGNFMSVGMKARSFAAAIDLDADTIAQWNPYLNGEVLSMNIRNKVMYMGGYFSRLNDSARLFNAALDLKNNKVLGWYPKADGPMRAIQLYKKDVYIGGEFDTLNGQPRHGLAKLDSVGNLQPWIGITDTFGRVVELKILKDTLYVGGQFRSLGGQPRYSLGGINLITGLAMEWEGDTCFEIHTMLLKNDTLYTAGSYLVPIPAPTPSKGPRNVLYAFHLGKRTLMPWFGPSQVYDDPVNDMFLTDDNRLYIAGAFNTPRLNVGIFALPIPAPNPPPPGGSAPNLLPFNPKLNSYGINAVYVSGNKLFYGGNMRDATVGHLNAALYLLPHGELHATIFTDTNGVCSGIPVTVRAKTSITYGVSYYWNVNGVNINNPLPYYTSVPANKDSIFCVVTVPANGCLSQMADTTDSVVFKVTPTITPDITIAGPIEEEAGKPVTVKATVKDAATGYSIEWFNKGVSIGKTTVDSLVYTKGSGTDSIYAVITPRTDTCYITDTSALVKIDEKPVGIGNITGDVRVMVYPNPFDTYVKVAGVERGDILILYDVTGRKISAGTSNSKEDYLLETGKLKTGIYVLKVTDPNGMLRKSILIQKQ